MEFFGIAKFFINEKIGKENEDDRDIYEDLIYGNDVAEEEEIRVLTSSKLRRREALFGEEVTRAGLGRAEYYEDNHIHSCDKEESPPHKCPYAKKNPTKKTKVYIANEEIELSLISAMVVSYA
uniref:Uncharacterized protein n=1 Tax=Caenorhabditis tropicalis TaxID=1561998 RepID=A0A1I7URA6_9PELO